MSLKVWTVIALVLLWLVFVWQLVTATSTLTVGFAGLAAGVITGVAFPSRRQIVRETR